MKSKDLIEAIQQNKNLDNRLKPAREIKRITKAVRTDPGGVSEALLEKEIGISATIVSMLTKEITENFKDDDGNLNAKLQTLLRFQASGRAAMLALNKIKPKQRAKKTKGIGDLFAAQEMEND